MRPILLFAPLFALAACAESPPPTAEELHFEAIVIDGHVDLPSAMHELGIDMAADGSDTSAPSAIWAYAGAVPHAEDGRYYTHTDLARMRAGGLDAAFFSIWVDPAFVGKTAAEGGGPLRRAVDMIGTVHRQVQKHADRAMLARTADDVRRTAREGRFAVLLGVEGGHAIENSLDALTLLNDLGVRYMTLTHNNTNDWADSSGDRDNPDVQHHGGLTDFGREVVLRMNELGMLVDVSHVSDATIRDALETSRAPVIASHSSARALADHGRNIPDDLLRAIAENGGVVMVNFYDGFIDPARVKLPPEGAALKAELEAKYGAENWPQVSYGLDAWMKANMTPTPLSILLDHIDHIAKVAGVEHVGLGSDFDGVTSLPQGVRDVTGLPNITAALLERGYTPEEVQLILGGNTLRVLEAAERVAREMGGARRTAVVLE